MAVAASRPGSWLYARTARHVDRLVLNLSGGQHTFSTILSGLEVIWLTTIGAKSGEKRTVPLIPLPDGENLVLMPTNFGQAHHPSWYYNLKANPQAWVTYKGRTVEFRAREATPSEAPGYWQRAEQLYVGYKLYRQRATSRQIPLFVLEPVREVAN
jgi:deazaflavin-dependent oxidoreductase (nitroreductase family)